MTTSAFDLDQHLSASGARVRGEEAQTTAEYAVILTAITVSVVLAVALLATNLGPHITDIANLVVKL